MTTISTSNDTGSSSLSAPEQTPLPKVVDRGVKLVRAIAKFTTELEGIKLTLRGRAKDLLNKGHATSPVLFQGNKGCATVTFKADSMKVADGKKLMALKEKLAPEIFHNLFDVETVATPCKDFKKKLENASEQEKTLIKEYFKYVPNTPAVEFSK